MSKTIQIVSKRTADAILVESLFTAGGTLNAVKYCTGKYKAGSFPVGREIEVGEHVVAVWAERRKDSHGPYTSLYCLTK